MANSSSSTFPTNYAHSPASSSASFSASESASDGWALGVQPVSHSDFWEDCIPPNHVSSSSSSSSCSSSSGQSDLQARKDRTTTTVHTTTATIFRGDASLVEIYAPAIGRVVRKCDEKPLGTCFLIAPATVMTCFHVIPKAAPPGGCKAQFFGKTTVEESHGSVRKGVYFEEIEFDPDGSKMICRPENYTDKREPATAEKLDYSILSLKTHPKLAKVQFFDLFSDKIKPLTDLLPTAYVFQHPDIESRDISGQWIQCLETSRSSHQRIWTNGEFNVATGPMRMCGDYEVHYASETAPGSSGGPVTDANGTLIGLHYQGPISDCDCPRSSNASAHCNAGVRMDKIVEDLTNSGRLQLVEALIAENTSRFASPTGNFIFGKPEWERCFGVIENVPSLPRKYKKILSSKCPFNPKKRVKDTHILVLIPNVVNGQPYTLNALVGLLENRPDVPKLCFRYDETTRQKIIEASNNTRTRESSTLDRPYWGLMTREVIPGSLGLSAQEQERLITSKKLEGSGIRGRLPTTLEAATCVLMWYMLNDKDRLYSGDPLRATLCAERVQRYAIDPTGCYGRFIDKWLLPGGLEPHVTLGNFTEEGLSIVPQHHDYAPFLGAACFWELSEKQKRD